MRCVLSLLSVLLSGVIVSPAFADVTVAVQSGSETPAVAAPAEGAEPTTAEEAIKKANELAKERPADGLSDDEKQTYFREKFQKVLGFYELALKLNPEPELRRRAMIQKFSVLSLLANMGVEGMDVQRDEFLKAAASDTDEEVAGFAKSLYFSQRLQGLRQLGPEERAEQMTAIKGELLAAEPSVASLQQVKQYLMVGTRGMDSAQAVSEYKQFIDHFKASKDEDLQKAAESLEATIRRLSLVGNSIEVTGKTISGEEFSMDSLKGKVVLVDFWATWCGPCIAEFPEMRKLYQTYKSHGFEVVGISLDDDKEKLTTFMEKQEVPWIVLWDPNTKRGWDNPVATNYGIDAIPCMILVKQDGKVISTDARGHKLKALLAELFPDVKVMEEATTEEKADAAAPVTP